MLVNYYTAIRKIPAVWIDGTLQVPLPWLFISLIDFVVLHII